VRSKIIKDGISVTDFLIGNKNLHGINNYFEALGIESPGFTSAPAIAKEIVDLALGSGWL
jgi:glycine/D-amino acid oxidase-like deaminating enzyme